MINAEFLSEVFKTTSVPHARENMAQYHVDFCSSSFEIDTALLIEYMIKTPARDCVCLTLSSGADDSLQVNRDTEPELITRELAEMMATAGDTGYRVEVCIDKETVDGTLSIYDFSAFEEWLTNCSIKSVLEAFQTQLKPETKGFTFACLNERIEFGSQDMRFSSCSETKEDSGHISSRREVSIKKRKEVTQISGLEIKLVPEDFHRLYGERTRIADLFDNLRDILSIAYVADEVYFNEESFSFCIKGNSLIEEKVLYANLSTINLGIYYQIYEWVYAGGSVHDKVQIVRNILSLHCNYSQVLSVKEEVLDTIKSNYNLFLRGNVKDYLSIRNELTQTIQKYCDHVSESINSFAGTLKGNFVAIIGYLVALLFTKGLNAETGEIFSYDVSVLSSFVILGSVLVCIFTFFHTMLNKRYYNKMIGGLKQYYSDLFTKEDIEHLISENDLLKTANENYRINLILVTILWLASCVGLYLLLDWLSDETPLLLLFNIF